MQKKTCSRCRVEKGITDFHRLKRSKDGRNGVCIKCRRELYSVYSSQENVRKKIAKNSMDTYWRRKRLVDRYKMTYGCYICGYKKCTEAMDLHHVNPRTKTARIASMMRSKMSKLKAEIRKCVILCSNCHREFHAGITDIPCRSEEK